MVEHWSEKPGVDSSILSLGISFRPNLSHFVVVQELKYLGATAPLRTVYFVLSLLELCQITLKSYTVCQLVSLFVLIFWFLTIILPPYADKRPRTGFDCYLTIPSITINLP